MWSDQAVCAQPAYDPDMWFAQGAATRKRAKALCRTCPVQEQCLLEAIEYERMSGELRYGIHGGLDENERRRLMDGRRIPA